MWHHAPLAALLALSLGTPTRGFLPSRHWCAARPSSVVRPRLAAIAGAAQPDAAAIARSEELQQRRATLDQFFRLMMLQPETISQADVLNVCDTCFDYETILWQLDGKPVANTTTSAYDAKARERGALGRMVVA